MGRAELPPRRFVLTGGLAAAVAAATALSGCSAKSAPEAMTAAPQPRPSTPEAAYARLMEGNKRWVGPVVTGSVEFGPVTAGTPLILVLGHQRCGAIDASYQALRDGNSLPGNLQAISKALEPAYAATVKNPGADPVDTMIRHQIKLTADELRANADLAPLVKKGSVAVVGGYYSLDTGLVEVLTGAPAGAAYASPYASPSASASPSGSSSGSASPSQSASEAPEGQPTP